MKYSVKLETTLNPVTEMVNICLTVLEKTWLNLHMRGADTEPRSNSALNS